MLVDLSTKITRKNNTPQNNLNPSRFALRHLSSPKSLQCLKNGSKECLEGWTGPECEIAECAPGCHPEHGFCDRPRECLCKMGWEGPRCDRCMPMPGCLHGSCNASFECNCLPGWDGFFCNRRKCLTTTHCRVFYANFCSVKLSR